MVLTLENVMFKHVSLITNQYFTLLRMSDLTAIIISAYQNAG